MANEIPKSGLVTGKDGISRCFWCQGHDDYRDYHDSEWGFPVKDDQRLFEKNLSRRISIRTELADYFAEAGKFPKSIL